LTIAEIAAAAGVSIPTVSRVLNQRPDVAPATRDRVQRLIAEQGYVRSRAARALGRGHSGLVDLVVPTLDSEYVFVIICGVEEVLDRLGVRLVLSITHDQWRRERQWLARVTDGSTDGAILVVGLGQSPHLDALRRSGVPFVVVDHRGELGPQVPSVGATNWAGGKMATEYLLSLGHRRIAVITGPPSHVCSRERLAGYRAALESAGVAVDASLIRPGEFVEQAGYTQTEALLALAEPPTAIFAGCDRQAMGVYSALHAHGVAVPRDMSVIGFDDVPSSATAVPPLTTVRQPLMEMGRVATTMLLRLISRELLDSTRVELATSLVTRASCAPPASVLSRGPRQAHALAGPAGRPLSTCAYAITGGGEEEHRANS
jgi:LacI family transcriptional regulator